MLGLKRSRAAPDDRPPEGMSIADSLEGIGETMIFVAGKIREREPLPLHVMRDHCGPIMRATIAMGDLLTGLLRAK